MRLMIEAMFKNNTVFRQMLSLCPTLAVTSTVINGIGMGLATTVVLIGASVMISGVRKFIPDKVRIPSYIVIIASFTTIVDLLMNAYAHDLHKVLGLFIPLIVVNCVVLGRAESFASKNSVPRSFLDALGTGLGFTLALVLLASVRELLGSGSLFGIHLLPESYPPVILMILPPGAFLALGFLMAGVNKLTKQS